MTIRLSIISFAGTVRTLVAVGTERLASMLLARVFCMPLSGVTTSCSADSAAGAACGASAGIGCGFAGALVVRATGVLPVAAACTTGIAAVGVASVTTSGIWASPPSAWFCGEGSVSAAAGTAWAGAASAAGASGAGADAAGAPERRCSSTGHQLWSTEFLSTR